MKELDNDSQKDVVDLFWSGGWDSTFRLMQLLLLEKNKVQPHFMIWTGDSIGEPIKAMLSIRSKIIADYPETKTLLLPIKYFDSKSIRPNDKINQSFQKLEEKIRVGNQHLILAQYCEQEGYTDLEQGTLEDDNPFLNLEKYLTDYKIDENKATQPIYTLFKYFKFPLINWDKKGMDNFVHENGWEEILYLTWFCRRPKNGKPCGFCGNCTDTLLHGMGKRLPLKARTIAYIQLPFRKWWRKNYNKRSEGIYKYIKKALQHKA